MIFEKNIPFSSSIIWGNQKDYYSEKGIQAWDDDVPFYITSNPYIAHSYAKMAIAFIQDWRDKNPDAQHLPFIFLELGAGTGQFSFYFLKSFLALQETLKLSDIKIQYVMSDITTKAFDFWEKHPALQPYLQAGILDFSVYDLYHDTDIHLHRAQTKITKEQLNNPLIIVANYIFDSLSTDVFTVDDGALYEARATFETDADNLINHQPKDWQKVSITYQPTLITDTYYGDALDKILFQYRQTLTDSHFQFPVATLRALLRFQVLSNHQFLLLSSDKAYTNLEELDNCDYPELDFHGSFSVMINYHAVVEFLKMYQGNAVLQPFREHISTGIFSSGFDCHNLPRLSLSAQQVICEFSPADYFILYEHFVAHYKTFSLEVIASYLNLSRWDPYLFDQISDHLSDAVEEGDPDVIAFLSGHLSCIADNFYQLPTSEDTLFNIGVFLQNNGCYEDAITYYKRSEQNFGESDVVLFNMGMCYESLNDKGQAVRCLERASRLSQMDH